MDAMQTVTVVLGGTLGTRYTQNYFGLSTNWETAPV